LAQSSTRVGAQKSRGKVAVENVDGESIHSKKGNFFEKEEHCKKSCKNMQKRIMQNGT
jgi:hypothetical protein